MADNSSDRQGVSALLAPKERSKRRGVNHDAVLGRHAGGSRIFLVIMLRAMRKSFSIDIVAELPASWFNREAPNKQNSDARRVTFRSQALLQIKRVRDVPVR